VLAGLFSVVDTLHCGYDAPLSKGSNFAYVSMTAMTRV
jgi:hypothetical protein